MSNNDVGPAQVCTKGWVHMPFAYGGPNVERSHSSCLWFRTAEPGPYPQGRRTPTACRMRNCAGKVGHAASGGRAASRIPQCGHASGEDIFLAGGVARRRSSTPCPSSSCPTPPTRSHYPPLLMFHQGQFGMARFAGRPRHYGSALARNRVQTDGFHEIAGPASRTLPFEQVGGPARPRSGGVGRGGGFTEVEDFQVVLMRCDVGLRRGRDNSRQHLDSADRLAVGGDCPVEVLAAAKARPSSA